MKTFFTFSFFTKKKACLLSAALFFILLSLQSMAQVVTATEDFENETTQGVFSEGGINFNTTLILEKFPAYNFGYSGSANFLDMFTTSGTTTKTATMGINTTSNPGVSFKINTFAGYVSSSNGGATPYNGLITVSGIPVGSSTSVSATIYINSGNATVSSPLTKDANGMVNGLNFTGTPLSGLYFTTLTFTVFDTDINDGTVGTCYFELDHMNFTTSVLATNQYAIGSANMTEGTSGTTNNTYNITRSINTAAGSVQIQSSNGTAIAGTDYIAVPLTTVNFTAGGSLTQTVNVGINGSTVIAANKTFNMTLSNPTGGTIATATGVVTILNTNETVETFEDETTNARTFSQNGFNFSSTGALMISYGPSLGSNSSYALDTRAGKVTDVGSTGNVGSISITNPGISFYITHIDVFTSNNDGTNGTTASVNVTFIGTKADGTGTVSYIQSISAISGNIYQTVNFAGTVLDGVRIVSLAVVLPTGVNYVALDNFKYGTSAVAGTQVSVSDVNILQGAGGPTSTATFTVSRTNNTSAFSVNLVSSDGTATAGSDYVAYPSTTLNFTNGGALTQTVNVTILRNTANQSNGNFNMNLSGATNGAVYLKPVGIGTIYENTKIIETFEDETNAATTFSENTVTFSASGRFQVFGGIGSTNGTNSSHYFLSPTNGAVGSMGKISITSSNKAFKIISLDAWVGTTKSAFSSGSVTFTGTLYGGGTVTTTKTITATSNTGTGWQQNVTFTNTPLDNVLLTDLEVITYGSLTDCDIDNFAYSVYTAAPYLEVADASSNVITNNSTASTTYSTDFGTACYPGNAIVKTYTLKNTGAANLIFYGSPLATVTGTNAAQFLVTTPPVNIVLPGASTTISVTYTPNAVTTQSAAITLTCNDASNTPFVINIRGTASAAINLSTQPTSQVMSGNGTNGLGSATFSVSATNATYQWQIKSGSTYSNLANTSVYSGVTSNTLTLTSPPASLNNAIYNCVLSGTSPCSAVSSNDVALSIISPSGTLPSGLLTGTDITTGTDAGWTFYYTGNNVLGFAIYWNGNTAAKSSALISTINGLANSVTRSQPGLINTMSRYWNVTGAPIFSNPVRIRFYYSSTDKSVITTNALSYAVNNSISNDGFKWFKTVGTSYLPANLASNGNGISGNIIILTGTESSINGVYQTEFAGITSFSGGTGAASAGYSNIALPVNLLYFKAENMNDGNVDLSWSTASEKSSALFNLERSTNGIDFTNIATVPSKGTTLDKQDYGFKDAKPNIGINYYRLSEVSVDGVVTKFPIKTITISGNQVIKIYPNPLEGRSFYVAVNNAVSITLKTITGQLLDATSMQVSSSLYAVKPNVALTAGVYLVTIKTVSGEETTQRLLVK